MAESSLLKRSAFGIPVLPTIFVCLLAYGIYLYFFAFKAQIEFEIEISGAKQAIFKVYWSDGDRGFTEANSNQITISNQQRTYSMLIGNLGSSRRLRIDPIEFFGKAKISRIEITQIGYESIILSTNKDFQQLEKLQQLNTLVYENNTLVLSTTGKDSQLLLNVNPVKNTLFPLVHIFNLLLIVFIISALSATVRSTHDNLMYVPYLLSGALVLALIMASITTYNVHPDEKVHYKAVEYYSTNLFPPSIEDPAIEDTFSQFGKSRLSAYEIYYQVAGYFTRLLAPFQLPYLLSARLFNVFMLAVLLLLSIHKREFRCFTLPLLITPQAWYLFSYVDSDAFGLFVVIITAYQAAVKTSLLNRYLSHDAPPVLLADYFGSGDTFRFAASVKTKLLLFYPFPGNVLTLENLRRRLYRQKKTFSQAGFADTGRFNRTRNSLWPRHQSQRPGYF